jgi:hypothetical protein
MAGVLQSASNKTSGGAVAESFLTNDNTKRISDRGFGFMPGEILSLAMRAKSSYSQFANVRIACQQIVPVIVRLQNSNAAVTALVDSLRHDPFYLAITQQFRNDEGRRRRALARYFDYSMNEGVRIGRLVVWPDASVGAAVWLLPTETSTYNAEREAKAEFLEERIGTSSRDVYARIMKFMVPRASAAVDSSSWLSELRRRLRAKESARASLSRPCAKPIGQAWTVISKHSIIEIRASINGSAFLRSEPTKNRSQARRTPSCAGGHTIAGPPTPIINPTGNRQYVYGSSNADSNSQRKYRRALHMGRSGWRSLRRLASGQDTEPERYRGADALGYE